MFKNYYNYLKDLNAIILSKDMNALVTTLHF